MPLNNFDNERKYTKYKRHVDESKERISANHINKIQTDINDSQFELNRVKDTAFTERVYTIFENNKYTNAMFIDTIKSGEYINKFESSEGLLVDYENSHVTIQNTYTTAAMVSTLIESTKGPDSELNDFFLISSEVIPVGCEVNYFLEAISGEKWPILQNKLKLPMHLSSNLKFAFKIICELKGNALGEMPTVNGYAVLYWDKLVEEDLGMINPDLQRFP